MNQLKCGKIRLSSVLLNLPQSPDPSKGSEPMIRLLTPNHPWYWQPPQTHRFQCFSFHDCSLASFAPVIPPVNPPAAAVGAWGAPTWCNPLVRSPGAAPVARRALGATEEPGGQRGQGPCTTKITIAKPWSERCWLADARCADKFPKHLVESARGGYLKPIEWEIRWPLANIILH